MAKNVDTPEGTGKDREPLTSDETEALQRAFRRTFQDVRLDGNDGILRDKLWEEYDEEITFAAEVARAQFDEKFDGASPQTGRFGIDRLYAGYFGYDTWDDSIGAYSSPPDQQDWLDASATNIGGGSGRDNPIRVGQDVVHLITGVGSYSPAPKTVRIQFIINDNPHTAFSTRHEFTKTDSKVKFFESPKLLTENTDVYARAVGDVEGTDELYPIGVTFIREKQQRNLLPSDLVSGTDDDIAGEP